MSDESELDRGRMAEDVLNNPVYRDAYHQIEQGLTQAWRESRNHDEREEIHQLLRMLDKVKQSMEGVMRRGEFAKASLVRRQNALQKIGRRLSGD